MLKGWLRLALLLPALVLVACRTAPGADLSEPSATSASAPGATTIAASPSATEAVQPPTATAVAALVTIRFSTAGGGAAPIAVEIEANDAERERGLMGVTSLPEDQGQIFVFQDIAPNQDVRIGFWMKDTLIPLSLAFISADQHVQEIQDMQPQTLDTHAAQQPYRYAVEANQGWFTRHGVAVGASVDLSALSR